jgi:hypothetical protein
MIGFKIKPVQRPPSADNLDKQMRFGTAVGLTKTAKDGQTAVQGALRGNFTLRGTWFEQNNKFGIKVKPATKADLSSEVRSSADWLLKQYKGGNYLPYKHNLLAIPTSNVRRNKRQIVPRAQRPLNLKNAFVITTKKGVKVLFQRKGRGRKKDLVAMYILVPKVRIHAIDAFFDPITKVIQRRGPQNIIDGIAQALASAK